MKQEVNTCNAEKKTDIPYYGILDAAAKKLGELFPEYTIYMNLAEQKPQIPCFLAGLLELTEKQVIGQRYLRKTKIAVRCLQEPTEEPGRGQSRIADTLLCGLEYIELKDGLLRGSDLVCRMEDNIIKFEASYNFHVIKPVEREPPMEALDTDLKMKGR